MIERHPISPDMRLHPLRAQDLTASDIGAAIGVDPYKSKLALWAEKSGLLMASADNPMMRRGRWLEGAVVAALRDEFPDWDFLYPPRVYLRDPESRLGATPDAFATDGDQIVNVQLKVIAKPEFERRWAMGPPMAYVLQTLTEGMLAEADRSLLAALVIDTYSAELHLAEVPRHAAAEARLHDIAAAFWASVNTGQPPPADVSRDAETVAAMFPQSAPEPVLDLSGDNRLPDLLDLRAVLKESITEFEKTVAGIDSEVKCKLGEAERAFLPGWKISWKTQTRAACVIAESSFRVLRVTRAKEEA